VALVIEVGGSQHTEPEYKEADEMRDAYLKELELKVLRFDNHQVQQLLNEALEVIYAYVENYLR